MKITWFHTYNQNDEVSYSVLEINGFRSEVYIQYFYDGTCMLHQNRKDITVKHVYKDASLAKYDGINIWFADPTWMVVKGEL